MPAVVVARNPPRTQRELTFLRAHILRQRRKEKEGDGGSGENPVENISAGDGGEGCARSLREEKGTSPGSEDDHMQSDASEQNGREQAKESEVETVDDIEKQKIALQSRLEKLKEEKHCLFQQLKMVLHEEERKRTKELEDKQESDKIGLMADVPQSDPRLTQVMGGVKRTLPMSPNSAMSGLGPSAKQHRGPLLPTPEPFLRPGLQASGHYSGPPHQPPVPPQQHFGPRAPMRPGYQDQRFPHMQAPPGSHDHHMTSHPQLAPQGTHGMPYSQPHPHMHDMQPQFPGMQMAGYQYPPGAPSHFGSIGTQQSPSAPSSQPMVIGQYQHQPMIQQGYIQPHPHDMHMQGQPHPHDVHMVSYTQQPTGQPLPHEPHMHSPMPTHHADMHYIAQQGQMMVGQSYGEYSSGGVGYGGHVHDPRHQKLLADHQRSGSTVTSPKQDGGSLMNSPSQSPANTTSTRDRRHTKK